MVETKMNFYLRQVINKKNQKKLHNHDFTLICNNCNGGFLYHDLSLKFCSPFINLWLTPKDFIKYLQDVNFYSTQELIFVKEEGIDYPVAYLGDIKIYFMHYKTEKEAKAKWEERSSRMNFDNAYILFIENEYTTEQDLIDFDQLPFENKVVFVHQNHPEIKCAFKMTGHENDDSFGGYYRYLNNHTGKKYYDEFDYVSWFNHDLKILSKEG